MANRGKAGSGRIPSKVMEYITDALQETCFGEVVLVAQDGRLIQVERTERRRVDSWPLSGEERITWDRNREAALCKRIEEEFAGLSYGRLTIAVAQGRIKHMSRLEMQRFMDGEGI